MLQKFVNNLFLALELILSTGCALMLGVGCRGRVSAQLSGSEVGFFTVGSASGSGSGFGVGSDP